MGKQMPDMDCSRGAPMGRFRMDREPVRKCRLFKVRLDSGGYDDGGAYWGHGGQLWCCTDDDGFRDFTRADSRAKAYERIQAGTMHTLTLAKRL